MAARHRDGLLHGAICTVKGGRWNMHDPDRAEAEREVLQRAAEEISDLIEDANDVFTGDILAQCVIADPMRSSSGEEYRQDDARNGDAPAYGFLIKTRAHGWVQLTLKMLPQGSVPDAEELIA